MVNLNIQDEIDTEIECLKLCVDGLLENPDNEFIKAKIRYCLKQIEEKTGVSL